jgi:hypothetical protein
MRNHLFTLALSLRRKAGLARRTKGLPGRNQDADRRVPGRQPHACASGTGNRENAEGNENADAATAVTTMVDYRLALSNSALASASSQKVMLQGQLPNIGAHRLDVHRGLGGGANAAFTLNVAECCRLVPFPLPAPCLDPLLGITGSRFPALACSIFLARFCLGLKAAVLANNLTVQWRSVDLLRMPHERP